MGVVAVVMAGGKSSRMGGAEKPLLKVGRKTMLERVVEALRESRNVREILIAVSGSTPQTLEAAKSLSLRVVETPGNGFIPDVRHVIKKYALFFPVLIISADLPLITGRLIDRIIARYKRYEKPALMAAVPAEAYERLGVRPQHSFEAEGKCLVPVGINIIDGRHADEPAIDQEILILEKAERVVNVNTPRDLRIVRSLAIT
jgi:adenosylcobinamide-phosphate guanylyltransferase